MSRSVAFLTAVTLAIAACAGPADPYPLPADPPTTRQLNPVAVGQPIRAVLIYVEVRPGDTIELRGADAIGTLDGATVEFLVSRPVSHPDGTQVIGETWEPLLMNTLTPASEVAGPDNTIGIGAQLTATRAGRFEISNVRLHYRINGGEIREGEGIDTRWTVCADVPAPADCPEDPPG